MISKLTVIGVGLIGGSLIRALREAEAVEEVVGLAQTKATLDAALALNIIDQYETDISQAVKGADVVVVATPVGTMQHIFQKMKGSIDPEKTIVTDVGSTKQSVIADIKSVFGEVPSWFVPGHPIAGTENSGVEHSFETLFNNNQVILTPTTTTNQESVEKITKMWQIAGANVVTMSSVRHDEIFAATSHLPHVLAYAILGFLATKPEYFRFSGGGFKDFTRIVASDPKMWRDICLANAEELGKLIKSYQNSLTEIADCIAKCDGDGLLTKFTEARQARIEYLN